MYSNVYVFLTFISFLHEMRCLRVTELRLSPWAVRRGGRAALQCLYELQGAPLYCVKWYRGRHEFYRYSPGEVPSTRIFPFSGINVDISASNATQVVLQRVDFALTGNFSCEVSADAPSFSTAVSTGHLEVVSIPQGVPVIVAEHLIYDPGDILRANCTAPASKPKANITLLINGLQITPGQLTQKETAPWMYQAQLSITLMLLPEHFTSGPPRLQCSARILDLYREDVELQLFSSRGAPRLERVTSSGSQQNHSTSVELLILLAALAYCTEATGLFKYS